jgi:hypothetical protein
MAKKSPNSVAYDDTAVATIDGIAICLGNKNNMTVPSGSDKMYFENIRYIGREILPNSKA